MVKIGIMGGSGLDNPDILEESRTIQVKTEFGEPSSDLKIGKIKGIDVVLIGRHGNEHTIAPSFVNNRANIMALKDQGCTHIIATTAVGSLKEEIGRGDLVIVDQFIDFTRKRKNTFHESFEPHKPIHTPMGEAFSKELRALLHSSCEKLDIKHHKSGTVITIEGPRFSTKAESKMFIGFGADIINMSVAPEVALANEAGILYAVIAMSTDYDCWKEDEEPVTWDAILEIFSKNVEKVTSVILDTIEHMKEK